jgi:hypothetical protein
MKRILVFLILVFQLTFHSSELMAQSNPYESTLLTLCDALLATQINDPADPNFGALVCPSTNPEVHPTHSRAAEAVYPFAVAWKLTGKVKYRDAAIKLGNWLITVQETSGKKAGGWSEVWPDPEQKGWFGTTTDQLISMAGAYAILKPRLNTSEIENWNSSMEKAAEFVMANFPVRTNINYNPTGAATLVMAFQVLDHPKQSWLIKADSLMNTYTLKSIDRQNLLTGEGMGVDGGYNIAQSIGFIALYAILKNDPRIRQIAADLLKAHYLFVYPNGSVDNSWGTRSFKWSYESGTKTAPGVYFSFALLADMDPKFDAAGLKCLEYLNQKCMNDGWIVYGPHAKNHESGSPPCNYSTFARAQSIALAIEYGAKPAAKATFPAQENNWYKFFPDMNVAVIRTDKIMATVSAYGEIRRYPRPSVCRGGSISNLWYKGFGENGFMQSSSTASYQRIEGMHMPIEKDLLPLTPRIECNVDSNYFSNIFEDVAMMNIDKESDNVKVSTAGNMKTTNGTKSKVNYNLTHRFYADYLTKELTVKGESQEFRLIEPIVNDPGTTFHLKNDSTVIIKTRASKAEWELKVTSSTVPFRISLGTDSEKYWCPFPAVEAFPIIISFKTVSNSAQTIKICLGMTDDKTDTK